MGSPLFDLPRPRLRRPSRREAVHVLHVIAGHEAADAAALDLAIANAARGRVRLERVVGLGRALARLEAQPCALVLLQARHLDVARVALGELRHAHPALPVILLTAAADESAAVAAVRAGAEDCLGLADATGPALVRAMLCALERTSHAATLRTQAVTDPLTGLANRHGLQPSLDHALAMARRTGRALAVLFLDLDGFKDINDVHGHEAGDRVLQELARRIVARTRDMDTVARLGGDEFVVVMEDLADPRFAATLARKLVTAAAAPFDVQGQAITLTASVGISVYPSDGEDGAALIRHADAAMYAAKSAGKHQFRYYGARMNEHSRTRTLLDQALAQALARHELELHYQPVWHASEPRIVAGEALLRWRRPGHGLLAPPAFLADADEAQLAVPLTAHVLGEAAAAARRMRAAGFTMPISVNLSRRQLLDGEVVIGLQAALADLDPAALQLEVREAVLTADDPRLTRVIEAVSALGVPLVVDDFGSGVSSLRALTRVRPAAIKIDGAVTADLPEGREAAAIVSAVTALARTLGVPVVGEGVETEPQARRLRALGCEALQGYFYGHALPVDEWLAYLRWACTAVVGTDRPGGPHLAHVGPTKAPRQGKATWSMPVGLPRIPGAALPKRGRARVVVGPFRN